ncbi:unnamed protein product [Rotaria sp. Silwood2]|nr:unnamed protein product [Rotaria sp. Silwood2]
MSSINKNEYRQNLSDDDDDDENDEDNFNDEQEEEINILEQVQGLFSSDIFPNVIEMFRAYQSQFDLVEFLKAHQIVSQYDYIRLINYIRLEKPSMNDLKQLTLSTSSPWADDKYFTTVIDNDPALQFDIEEDLNQLGDLTISKTVQENDQLIKANQRIRELEEMVDTLKSMTSRLLDDSSTGVTTTSKAKTKNDIQDDDYFATYNHYDIHKDMLQDKVRTESYLKCIKENVDVFRNKIVLDVGCGTGILSMACIKYGHAKMVIAVDMSDMIYDAMAIAKENNIDESKLVFIHGRIEDVNLPVEKVDIIISEWMGYFLLFECMLESIIFARNTYLDKENGLVLPDDFSIHMSAFHSDELYHEHIGYWSDVYGFEMNTVAKNILVDGHVIIVPANDIMTSDCCIKTLDIYTCSNDDITFTHPFTVEVLKSGSISGFVYFGLLTIQLIFHINVLTIMADNEDTTTKPPSTTLGTIGLLANNPLYADPNELQQTESTTNINNDTSKVTSNDDFGNDDNEKTTNDLINDLQSESITPDNNNFLSGRTITSGRLITDQDNSSTPNIIDPSVNHINQGPKRSMSESVLLDHHDPVEQSSPLPIQQDESSTDGDDLGGLQARTNNTSNDDFINQHRQDLSTQEEENNTNRTADKDSLHSKTETINDSERPSSATKHNILDETTHFNMTSPKPSTSRIQSASSKRSQTIVGDEKRVQLSDETGSNTDNNNNQEVAPIIRPSSRTKSRSSTSDDLHKTLADVESSQRPQSPFVGEQAQSSSRITSPQTTKNDTNILTINQSSPVNAHDEEQKQTLEPSSTATISSSSSSRRESTNKLDQQQTSRTSSAVKSKVNDNSSESSTIKLNNDFITTNDQSKLIKPGEQLQIPTNDIDNEQNNSPPPSPSAIKQMISTNPVLESSLVTTDQDRSRPPSETNRKSQTSTSISNEKVIDGDVVSSRSRRSSNISQQQTTITDQKPNLSSSRKGSSASEQQVSSKRGNIASEQKPISRRNSLDQQGKKSSSKSSSRKTSLIEEQQVPSRRPSQQKSATDRDKQLSSSRRTSSTKQEQTITNKDTKDSRRSSTDTDIPLRTSAKQKQERILSNDKRQSSLRKRSGQQSTTTDQSVVTPIIMDSKQSQQQNEKHSSVTDSDYEQLNTSKLPRVNSTSQLDKSHHSEIKQTSSSETTTPRENNQTSQWTKQVLVPPIQLTDDETLLSRPQSPNVEQIAEHNQSLAKNKKRNSNEQKNKEQHRSLHRSNSAESFNYIPLVDDKSIDSTSDINTEYGQQKRRRVKSKKKDVETNTDQRIDSKKQQELTPQKPLKATKSMSDHQSMNRRSTTKERTSTSTPDTELDSNRYITPRSVKKSTYDNEPVNVNVTVLVKNLTDQNKNETSEITTKETSQKEKNIIKSSTDNDRHTQSDTEQIVTEKQKTRRRPKRISRTTQTYECVFRRMEREQHEELRPTNDTDKNIQTRKSQLCPTPKSPRKHPTYISTDAFKIEEILPKQFPQGQRNASKTSMVARSISPQNGKLLILRPTLPFHHTDAVNVQRVCLQYAIDLIPNENKLSDSPYAQRSKSNVLKHSEQTTNLPMIRSSSPATNIPTNKSNVKDKPASNRIEDRIHQRKNGGAV